MTNQWQPISTAPRDGTWILGVHHTDGTMRIIQSDGKVNTRWMPQDAQGWYWAPTHWMPLPSPPDPPVTDEQAREAIGILKVFDYGVASWFGQSVDRHNAAVKLLRKWAEQGKDDKNREHFGVAMERPAGGGE